MQSIKIKSYVLPVFKEFKARVELETGKRIKCLRTINGNKYIDGEFLAFCKQVGIAKTILCSTYISTKCCGRVGEQNCYGQNKSYARTRVIKPFQIKAVTSYNYLLRDKLIIVNNWFEDIDGDVERQTNLLFFLTCILLSCVRDV